MFFIHRPAASQIRSFLTAQQRSSFSYVDVGATRDQLPDGYTIDHNRVKLGHGKEVFQRAVRLMQTWQMFKLGWVELFEPNTPIKINATVAVLVHHFRFWSLNAARIVYVLNDDRRYGFAYGTLQDHAEEGEERFSVEWSAENDVVSYDILAFSRPHQWQAQMARPISRRLQRRFARDSMAAMTAHRVLP